MHGDSRTADREDRLPGRRAAEMGHAAEGKQLTEDRERA